VLARAFGDLVKAGDGEFCIGHDVRESSPSLAEAASLGLRSGGHHVIHIGACTTPELEWYIANEGLDGGLMITGGSALAPYNGLRFYRRSGQPLPAAEVIASVRLQQLDELLSKPCNPVLRYDDTLNDYAAWLRQHLHLSRPCKLCLDAGNGMAGAVIEAVSAHFQQLRLWRIGFNPDPLLSRRDPDPLAPKAQGDVYNCVIAHGGELGAVLDMDGDRLAVLDERGRAIDPYALGMFLADILSREHADLRVIHDAQAAPADIDDFLHRKGIEARTLTTDRCGVWKDLHPGAPALYFDSRGHYGFSDSPGNADGLLALMKLLSQLTRQQTPLSSLIADAWPAKDRYTKETLQ